MAYERLLVRWSLAQLNSGKTEAGVEARKPEVSRLTGFSVQFESMDQLSAAPNLLLPYQAPQLEMSFGVQGKSGRLRTASAPNAPLVNHVGFDETFSLQHEMLPDVTWPEGQDLAATCSPIDDDDMFAWGVGPVRLAYSTSNGEQSRTSSGNTSISPQHQQRPGKMSKAEERRERRRMQNRAAQRHFRDRRKVELKGNVEKIDKMESDIKELSGENEKMERMIRALRRKCEALERERKPLRHEKRLLEGIGEGEETDGEAAAKEMEKHVKGVASTDEAATGDECRWHWMKVKRRKVEEKADWREVPSIFV